MVYGEDWQVLVIKIICSILFFLPISSYAFDVTLKLKGFNQEQEQKIFKAAELIKEIVLSEEFKKAVISKSFNNEFTFKDNAGLTNEQIYQKIIEGKELVGHNTTANGNMDLELVLYRDDQSNTIGYTYPHISHVYINEKFLNRFEPYQVANNLFHEWLHKIGFDHSVEKTPEREHSVPYALGYIVKDMAKGISQDIAQL